MFVYMRCLFSRRVKQYVTVLYGVSGTGRKAMHSAHLESRIVNLINIFSGTKNLSLGGYDQEVRKDKNICRTRKRIVIHVEESEVTHLEDCTTQVKDYWSSWYLEGTRV
jgi:hypothetical protein